MFKNPVCKVYRFQTTDSKWMLVKEQMAECTLSFSIPIQLLRLYIQEDRHRYVNCPGTGEYTNTCRYPPDLTGNAERRAKIWRGKQEDERENKRGIDRVMWPRLSAGRRLQGWKWMFKSYT